MTFESTTAPGLFTCPMCGTVHNGLHACTGHAPYYRAPELTEEMVRKIIREELERHRPILGTRHCHRCNKPIHATEAATMSATVVYCSIECAD